MAQLRANGPYIWVTWLPKLLSGLNSCEWASWFKAQHYSDSWARMPSDFDLSKWLTAHTALLNESRVTWERKGYSALTEGQNHFNLRGNSAVLAGKPDLVARKGDGVKIIDAKTGRRPAGDDLHVRPAQGAGAVPWPQAHRSGGLLRPRGQHPGRGGRRGLREEHGPTDNPVSIRDAGEACPQPR